MSRQPGSATATNEAGRAADGACARELSRLFEEHNRTLVSFLMNRLGSEAEAREVAQEAYVRILQLDEPGAISFLRAYLFRTAANIALDRVRHRMRAARLDEMQGEEDLAHHQSPERQALAAQAMDLLNRAVGELPPRYRHAFLAHRLEERPTADIGRDLGVNERQARNYVQRAIAYCRLRMDGHPESDAKAQLFK